MNGYSVKFNTVSRMGKRYYCDYCDRTFADSPVNRKKHVNGVQHQRNKKLHYDSFKDPAQLLAEETQKLPCKRFFQTGNCDFGVSCRYSHTNPQFLLESQAAIRPSCRQDTPEPKINVWLARWEKRRKCQQDRRKSKVTIAGKEDTENSDTFIMPSNIPPLINLPPSLLPPPPGGHPKPPKIKWG